MKFGVREICDVVLRAKAPMTIGKTNFVKDEPVMYFDSAKTSTVEGAATTVYATGGKGNARLIAWEGERTVTFTMEDALMSPLGFSILSGAGIVEAAGGGEELNIHTTAKISAAVSSGTATINLTGHFPEGTTLNTGVKAFVFQLDENGNIAKRLGAQTISGSTITATSTGLGDETFNFLVDFYVKAERGVTQLEITPDKFAGSYYLEADTLFRRQEDGVDMPAQFVIPNVKIQSAFNFSMASSGDPSTFTFTMDAFPDYTKFDNKKKVLFALQIIESDKLAPPPEVASVMGDLGRKIK